jgi:formyltetrahydrofolate deformylase
VLLRHGCNVISNHEFVDHETARFFMRTEFTGDVDSTQIQKETLAIVATPATVRLSSLAPRRIVVLCSREHHCLADLVVRHAFGELNANILAVVSNHPDLAPFVGKFGLPFHTVSHLDRSREQHESEVLNAIAPYAPDYLVLAKYMRVLSSGFVAPFSHRIINIHHSFLPAFVGARPYEQAFRRGVKIIGATAHFVTEALDQGPIIVQEVLPVDHTHAPEDLAQAGREVEKLALARALKLVFEDRVLLCGNRTIIFD